MTILNNHSHPVKKKDIVYQSMPPDTILLNLDNGFYYSTNEIGAEVWDCCDGRHSIIDIIKHISNQYNVSADEIKNDVLSFIVDMKKEGLLQIQNDEV
ncbi:MAG: hypothetical protein APF84_10600 [Gracilibacter sp. BRH_c7a]|nr:MAG: hypothetical protein APF84_10600 [Gracilibacter sp. BRH_c7a]